MKNILLTLSIVLGITPIIKAQTTCLPCDQLGMSVNVGSDTNRIKLYHSGQYLTHPQSYNVFTWEITTMQGNIISQDTIVNSSNYYIDHNTPISDTMNVVVYLKNDSAILPDGNIVNCFFEDQIYWYEGVYPSGTIYGRWEFVHGNVGSNVTDVNENQIDETRFNVFPSPASNDLYIDGPKEEYSLQTFNIYGQLFQNINNINGKQKIDVSSLPIGLYILKVNYNKSFKTMRFVKQ